MKQYKSQHYTDRRQWSYKPVPEPWWIAVLGGAVMGALIALGVWWGL